MLIDNKNKLKFFIKADRMMNFGKFEYTWIDYLKGLLQINLIGKFLIILRKYEYYINAKQSLKNQLLRRFYKYRWIKVGTKLGFTIYPNVFDYGLTLNHWGTIVIGNNNKIGAYALVHTCTCMPRGERVIGNFLRLSTGVKITGPDIRLGDGISIAANSVVTKDCLDSNKLLAGMPATILKSSQPWVLKDGQEFYDRFNKIEDLKVNMQLGPRLNI